MPLPRTLHAQTSSDADVRGQAINVGVSRMPSVVQERCMTAHMLDIRMTISLTGLNIDMQMH